MPLLVDFDHDEIIFRTLPRIDEGNGKVNVSWGRTMAACKGGLYRRWVPFLFHIAYTCVGCFYR
jgi:hypothetical protein